MSDKRMDNKTRKTGRFTRPIPLSALNPTRNIERERTGRSATTGEIFKQQTEPIGHASYAASSKLNVKGGERYELEEIVAEGGMGAVYRARDLNCERTVALKMLLDSKQRKGENSRRFMEEARITSQIEHPNIVPIHEVGHDADGNTFYTMKFIRGTALVDVLMNLRKGDQRSLKEYPLRQLLTIFQKTCDAVAFAHANGIVHRDLKPGNVMIGDYGEVLVLDWGLAKAIGGPWPKDMRAKKFKLADAIREAESEWDMNKTQSGEVLGTPGFMAPERARHTPAEFDVRSDIYSLGAILYSILALRPPVSGKSVQEILTKILKGEIPPPASFNKTLVLGKHDREDFKPRVGDLSYLPHCPDGQIPLPLSDIAMRAMATDPADRYPTVKELQLDIEAYLSGQVWHLIVDEDFSDPTFFNRWEVMGGKCEIKNGELRLHGGEPQMLLLKRDLPGDVRFEFECRQEGAYLNDAACLLSGIKRDKSWDTSVSGYAFKYGAYTNSFNVITRLDKKIFSESASPLVSGRQYHIRVERVGGRLSMQIDHQEVMSVVDREPLTGSERTLAGLLGWIADTWYRHIRIFSLAPPWQSDLLDTAERHLVRGNFGTAMDLFQEVLDSFPSADRKDRAERGHQKAHERNEVMKKLPEWRTRLDHAWPGVPVQMTMDINGLKVDIPPGSRVRDLTPLKGMPITTLRFALNDVQDLEPLRGMPLEELICGVNPIESLEPLKGMPLRILECYDCRIRTLAPIKGMNLTSFHCARNTLEDGLEALKGMKLLWLNCTDCGIHDITPLSDMPIMQLFCDNNLIENLGPLAGMTLAELSCSSNRIEKLQPLAGMRLNGFRCDGNRIADLSPLKGMPLSTLKCHNNRIKVLEPLFGMPLSWLTCGHNPLKNIGPFIQNPPKNFFFDCDTISTEELEWIHKSWSRDFRLQGQARMVETLIALRRMNTRKLRGLARDFKGHKYLFIPQYMSWKDANELSQKLGGYMVSIANADENDFINSFFPFGGSMVWMGLKTVNGKQNWASGERFTFNAFIDLRHERTEGPNVYSAKHWYSEPSPNVLNPFIVEWDE